MGIILAHICCTPPPPPPPEPPCQAAVEGLHDTSEGGKSQPQKLAHLLYNPCRLGRVPNALERGTKSAVAHKWGDWLHNPCRLGGVPNALERGTKSAVPVRGWTSGAARAHD